MTITATSTSLRASPLNGIASDYFNPMIFCIKNVRHVSYNSLLDVLKGPFHQALVNF